jgi:hypothetical protein
MLPLTLILSPKGRGSERERRFALADLSNYLTGFKEALLEREYETHLKFICERSQKRLDQ